jgi:hypothetical protein
MVEELCLKILSFDKWLVAVYESIGRHITTVLESTSVPL